MMGRLLRQRRLVIKRHTLYPSYSMKTPQDYVGMNRTNWDARVSIHLQGYELDRFRRDPGFLSSVVASICRGFLR